VPQHASAGYEVCRFDLQMLAPANPGNSKEAVADRSLVSLQHFEIKQTDSNLDSPTWEICELGRSNHFVESKVAPIINN